MRRVWTVVGAVATIGAVGALSYGVASAALGPARRVPPGPDPRPGADPTLPLRPPEPPPAAPDPGPLAVRLRDLIAELDDDELAAVRAAMPPHWWQYFSASTLMPTDPGFAVALHPLSIDISLWTEAQVDQLQSDLVAAMGFLKALELRAILQEAGVL